MRKTWKFIMACMTIACASLVVGCSDDDADGKDDDTEITNPVEPDPEEPDGSLQDPEKAKEKLNNVGKELVAMVDADDFKDLSTVANAFAELQEEEDDYNEPDYGMFAKKILAAARGNMGALYTMSRATHQASEYYGTYEYANGKWTWTENPALGKFVATFPADGKEATITATCSGGETDFTYDGETYKVPAKAEADIRWDNKTLAEVEVNTSNLVNTSPYKADVDATVKVGDKYLVTASVKASSTEVTANSKITIDGKEAVIGKGIVGGQNITADDEWDFDAKVNCAEGQAIILDDAYVTMKCDDVKGFSAVLDEDDDYTWEEWKPLTKEQRIAEVKENNEKEYNNASQDAADYAKYLIGNLRYKSQTEASATLGFQPYKDYWREADWYEYKMDENGKFITNEWGDYEYVGHHQLGIDWEYWEVEAVAVFSDGSKMSFDNLDGDNSPFKGFIDSLEDLIDAFGKLLD